MAKDHAAISNDLLEMKQKLAEWRSAQPVRTPLPDALWQPIVKLARKHGLYRTAKSLPIDYGTLKRRCSEKAVRGRSIVPASFVELIAPPSSATGCVIEMVRIETKGAVDWAPLLEGWRRRGA
jgi:hypothetical protein